MFETRSSSFLLLQLDVGLGQGKKLAGGCGGWTPTGKQITPTANTGKKLGGRVSTPLGLIRANAFIMISLVFHYLYSSVFITCFVLFLCSFLLFQCMLPVVK